MRTLVPAIRTYHWGQPLQHARAARYAKHAPIAEIWWSTHPSGPATYKDGSPISQDNKVTYLLKVLSIKEALSIQVHPNRATAFALHHLNPKMYPDSNPKPEMSLALTEFTAMCGLLPDAILKERFQQYRELLELANHAEEGRDEGFQIVKSILRTSNDPSPIIQRLTNRLRDVDPQANDECVSLFLQLVDRYGVDDIGVVAPFLLNIIHLKPFEAFVIPPGTLHAYVYGDCVECMAPSDNVVRAGLTSKPKDVQTLLMLMKPSEPPIVLSPGRSYTHPCTDEYFSLVRCTGNDEYVCRSKGTIALIVDGSGMLDGDRVEEGDSFLLDEGHVYEMSGDKTFQIIIAEPGCPKERSF